MANTSPSYQFPNSCCGVADRDEPAGYSTHLRENLKGICKKSDENVTAAYEFLFQQMKKPHSQIRYSCVQIAGELFGRSAKFRQLLVSDFPAFIQLTVGIHGRKLPPPERHAGRLKQLALRYIKSWHEEYGKRYKQLALGYLHLRNSMGINFDQIQVASTELHRSRQDDQRGAMRQKQLQHVEKEVSEKGKEIEENVSRMVVFAAYFSLRTVWYGIERGARIPRALCANVVAQDSCINMLAPKGEDFNEDAETWAVCPPTLRETTADTTLSSSRYSLAIDVSSALNKGVPGTEDNVVIHASLRETYRLLVGKHAPLISDWMKRIVQLAPQRDEDQNGLVKRIIRLRELTTEAKLKAEELGAGRSEFDKEEDKKETEFEEASVPTAMESRSAQRKRSAATGSVNRIFALKGEEGLDEDVTYTPFDPSATISLEDEKGDRVGNGSEMGIPALEEGVAAPNILIPVEQETREELLKRAPVVAYKEDLDHWDKETMQFNTTGLEYSHRFWGTSVGDNEVSQETLDRLKKRAVLYRPQLNTQLKECRHPLRGGKLCPRRQETTCPFHGPIIPRDHFGTPQQVSAAAKPTLCDGGAERFERGMRAEHLHHASYEENGSLDELEEIDGVEPTTTRSGSKRPEENSGSSSASAEAARDSDIPTAATGKDHGDVTASLGLEKIRASGRQKGRVTSSLTSPGLVKLSKVKEPKSAVERIEKRISSRKSRMQLNQAYQRDAQMRARHRQANLW